MLLLRDDLYVKPMNKSIAGKTVACEQALYLGLTRDLDPNRELARRLGRLL